MYNAEMINSESEFIELKPEWNDLLERSSTKSIFLTWEWIYSWWQVFKGDAQLLIITARDENNLLCGLAPLMLKKEKFYSFPVNQVTFIGLGLSDRQDFLISENDEQIAKSIFQKINTIKKEWTLIFLDQIPPTSHLFKLPSLNEKNMVLEESSGCPFIPIEGTWEDFRKALSSKMRRDLNNKTNKLNKSGEWQFVTKNSTDNVEEIIEIIDSIEGKSRKSGTGKEYFIESNNVMFMKKFIDKCLENDWFDFSYIEFEKEIIAVLFGFTHLSKYYAYIMTFDEQYLNLSPGKILLNEKIKWCFENSDRIKEFDFSRGDTYIKSRWAKENRQHQKVVFFSGSIYSRFIKLVVFGLRPFIKRNLLKRASA